LDEAERVPEEGILERGDDKIGSFAVEYNYKSVNSNVRDTLFQGIIFLQGFQFTKDIQCKKYFAKLFYVPIFNFGITVGAWVCTICYSSANCRRSMRQTILAPRIHLAIRIATWWLEACTV
jgi:hypothetical protein